MNPTLRYKKSRSTSSLFAKWSGLFMFLFLVSGEMLGQYSGTGTFTKINSTTDLTDGYYVVAYGTTFAMNNTNSGSFFTNTAITGGSGTITNPATDIVWKIETNGTGRTIYNESSARYVSYTGTNNTAEAFTTVTTDNQRWTFGYTSSLFTITNMAVTNRLLQYNTGSPRFACYTGSQKNITLYKLVPSGFQVTYKGNGNTAGSVPTDATNYASDATVTAKPNSGNLVRTNYTFAGWNTIADGSGTTYAAGSDTFSITTNTNLYAKWTPNYTITFANLQFPASGNIPEGGSFEVFGQVYAAGLTDVVGQGAGITAEFGYSTSNTNPTTWTNWQTAVYNVDKGNNDEYKTTFSGLALGTYHYATRFKYGSEPWIYGGFNDNNLSPTAGGIWDGTTNISGTLIVNSNVVTFANLEAPFSGNITQGGDFSAFAKVYKNGLTEPANGSSTINAWIGISTTNATTTASFNSGWTWIPASFSSQVGNDDIYAANIAGATRPAGTYYYVSRFSVTGSTEFRYGSINNGFWTAPANSGVLTITKPTIVLTPTTLSGFNYTGAAGPSAQQSFTASGTDLISNIVIAAPANYEVSTTSGSGFGSSVTLIQTGGVVVSTTVFVRLKAGLASGTYNEVLNATSTSATNKTVNLNGTVSFSTPPNNATVLKGCIANNQLALSWTAPTTGAVLTGYIVFALPNTSIPQMAAGSVGNASNYSVNSDYSSATNYTTLGKAVYKGTGTSVIITGLTNASQYTFKVVAYTSETGTGWASGINGSGSYNQTFIITTPNVLNLAATVNATSSTVTWNVVPSSVGCYEYMVVANAGAVSLTPSGNGSLYTANQIYTGANQVVYKGTGSSIIVTGLTEDVNYCYKVFVREINSGNQWSDGTSVCKTTGVNYCSSVGSTIDSTGITKVQFNTINQISTGASAYFDYNSVSTTVLLNNIYTLSVNVNTLAYQNYTKAWIDWNRDGDFNDSGEEYDLGDAYIGTNELTSNSPLAITVPSNATIGTTRMRIATQYFYDDTPIILSGCTPTYDYGEVEDYTINVTQPLTAEINVKGGAISIANGFDSPYGLNNTLFGSTSLNTDSVEKTFTIENIGIANLNLTGIPIIKIEGLNPTDFTVTQQAATPVINGTPTSFKIKFNPTAAGTRTANVRIENNDSDENPYIFTIEGTGICTVVPIIAVFPTSGPANTLVTFTSSTSDLSGATVSYNNTSLSLVSISTDKIEVLIPANANDGNFTIQLSSGCEKTQAFDVIDTQLTTCEANVGAVSNASDLIIYEVYDENGGSGGVITIYNRTGTSVNLVGYSIKRAPDYGGTYSTYSNLYGILAAGAVAVIGVSGSPCGYIPTGNGSFGSSGFNANDGFRLVKGAVLIDDVKTPNYKGYYLKRKSAFLNPNVLYNDSEWTTQNIAKDECLTGVGTQPILKLPPTVTLSSQYLINCAVKNTSLTVAGTEGFAGGLTLAYQWYVLGTTGNWTEIINGGIYAGATSTTLTISDISGLDDYQYYCQIRENGANCYTASKASLLRIAKKTWDGTIWSGDGVKPTYTEKAIITGIYSSTTNGGDIEACECEVTSTGVVTMNAGHTLNIQSAIINNGIINILDSGSLVQHNDLATYTGSSLSMKRTTQDMYRYDYTYWSSPVGSGFTLNDLSPNTLANKYFKWNSSTATWQVSQNGNEAMEAGKGYIVRAPQTFAVEGAGIATAYTANFIGKPNNGEVTIPVTRSSTVNKWNLIGNPYPSAINADAFLSLNAPIVNPTLGGTLYFWTHNTGIGTVGSTYSYNPSDYASWNGTGSAATSPGNNNAPLGKIAAGQGFFVRGIGNGPGLATFNNSMRVPGFNNQFFKSPTIIEKHRVWLNMKGTTKGFSQTLVGYVTDATNGLDNRFDGETFGGNQVTFYSMLDTKALVIQGRALPFIDSDTVPLGYKSTITENISIGIDHFDGLFENQNIYLEDTNLNIIHNLKTSDYTFAAVPGTFNSRFILRYLPEEVLSNPTFDQQLQSVIIRKNDDIIRVNSPYELIQTVWVYDLMGRLIFEQTNCNTNVFETNKVTQNNQTLIVKVQLNNGGVVTGKL